MTKPAQAGSAPKSSGASTKPGERPLNGYFRHHRQVAKDSFRRMFRTPLASLFTCLVIGIAVALPCGMAMFLHDIRGLTSELGESAQVTFYLKANNREQTALAFLAELNALPEIDSSRYIPKADALRELEESHGIGDVVAFLDANPLPDVVVATPTLSALQSPDELQKLQQTWSQHKLVERVQLDLDWVQRLSLLSVVVERVVWVLSVLLGAAVLLIIGNTIRLEVENRRHEIIVVKLVGGTDAFVRRPLLYMGLWLGMGSGFCAALLLELAFSWLNEPVIRLSKLYGSEFSFSGVQISTFLLIVFVTSLLGIFGARMALSRHLQAVEPA
ncbi:permease-like cell division protein FtsX [Oleiphilus messinensis]|nr:permease-like cell division protein FtsX [Oleiphilus messinensis]